MKTDYVVDDDASHVESDEGVMNFPTAVDLINEVCPLPGST